MFRRRSVLSYFIIILFLSCSSIDKVSRDVEEKPNLVAATEQGLLRGTEESGVLVWRGIRYAKAPIGALRFRAPIPVDKWDGVKNAVDFGPICPQEFHLRGSSTKFRNQSEDCLCLNVWAPKNSKNAPVMVWIHGGAYIFGAGSFDLYDGANLARRGVVVVTINYRLGAFGCMHFSDLAARAGLGAGFDDNPGLRDQVAALQWVRDNIAAFGGDPGNITIFGESAGASSVLALLCTPSAKGLFHKAIAQSPSPVSIYSRETGDDYAGKFLALVGLTPGEIGRLKDVPDHVLAGAVWKLLFSNAKERPGSIPFGPTAGTKIFPFDPLTAAGKGAVIPVPLLIGTNRDEATLFDSGKTPILPIKEWQIEGMLDAVDPGAKGTVLSAYHGYPSKKSRLQFATDAVFRQSSILFADLYSSHGATWAYRFDYVPLSLRIAGFGATHGSEVVYVFQNYATREARLVTLLSPGSRTRDMGNLLMDTWLSFARTGSPSVKGSSSEWKQYNSSERLTCILDREVRLVKDPDQERRRVWTGVGRYK